MFCHTLSNTRNTPPDTASINLSGPAARQSLRMHVAHLIGTSTSTKPDRRTCSDLQPEAHEQQGSRPSPHCPCPTAFFPDPSFLPSGRCDRRNHRMSVQRAGHGSTGTSTFVQNGLREFHQPTLMHEARLSKRPLLFLLASGQKRLLEVLRLMQSIATTSRH